METRKTVTIVFTDLAGSTALGERLDPEVLRRVMTNYFQRMREILERHGGTVEKYIGDAVVGVFGIPELHEDDALRAVRATAEMRVAVEELNRDLEARYAIRMETRTGVNTGDVLADEAGTEVPLAADAANTAARLEQAASPREILLGEPTYRLVRDAVRAEPAEPVLGKGKVGPVSAWRLLEVIPHAPGVARRLDSPMVGRDRELRLLMEAFEQSTAERACRLVTVVGTPGVGKSRLAAEFASWLAPRARVLRGRCLPYGHGITYWPVAEVIREAAGTAGGDGPGEASAKISSLLADVGEAGMVADRLVSVLGLSEAAAPTQEAFWSVRRFLEALAKWTPVAVVLEDIHWAEPTLLDLIEYLAGWSVEAPILLLCLARPDLLETRPRWGAGLPEPTTIRLEPLSEDESESLIDSLLGEAPLDEQVRARIRHVAEGNPLFVEETLRMLIDQGLLWQQDGRWTAAGDLSSIAIPPTIGALLAARLDRLTREERAVIQRASVVGKVFWWGAVAKLSPQEERPTVGARLQALVRRELIRPERSRFIGEDAFQFSHILIRDATYAETTKELRIELHERFADWLERRAADRMTEFEEVVGYHLEQAYRYRTELGLDEKGLAARAARHLASAGRRALAGVDIPAAISLLSRGTGLMEPADPLRVELLVDTAEALTQAGQIDRAKEAVEAAAEGAASAADDRLDALVLLGRWYVKVSEGPGDAEAAEEAGLRAVEIFERYRDDRGLARAWALLSSAHWWAGQAAATEEAAERARRHARAAGDRMEASTLLTLSGVLVQGPRPIDEAAARAEAILSEYPGNRTAEAYMSHALAHLRAWEGRFADARRLADRYRRILRENGQESNWAESSECAADVELMAGDVEAAVRIMTEGQRRLDDMRLPDPTILPYLADALYRSGRWDEAEAMALRVMESSQPLWRMLGRTVLARVRARQGRAEEAERLAAEALETARRTDYLVFQGRASLAAAEVLELLGREAEAEPLRREAEKAFERKGAVVWLDWAREGQPNADGRVAGTRTSRSDRGA